MFFDTLNDDRDPAEPAVRPLVTPAAGGAHRTSMVYRWRLEAPVM
jgi:hypothetical protein